MLTLPIPSAGLLLLHLAFFAAGAWLLHRHPPRHGVPLLATLAAIGLLALFELMSAEPPRLFEDFRHAYYRAGAAVLIDPAMLLREIERGLDGFVNLPITAYLFAPFALLPVKEASIAFTLAGVAATLAAWWLLVRCAGLDAQRALVLLFLFAACGPLHNSIKEGNTSHFVLVLLAGGLLCFQRGREVWAGVLFGVAAIIKLPLALVGAYFLLRGRWRVVAGGAAVGLLAASASLALFGWDMHLAWYRLCVEPFSGSPISAFNAQSIHGFVARLDTGAQGLHDWNPHGMSALGAAIARLLVGLTYAAMIAAIVRNSVASQPPAARQANASSVPAEFELLVVIVLACITSPLAWSHYYAWLLIPMAYVLKISQTMHDRLSSGIGWLAITLVCLPVLDLRPDSAWGQEVYARSAVSGLLFGGLLMLWALSRSRPITAQAIAQPSFAGGAA